MRIGVMGDTHGDTFSLKKAVAAAGVVDLWLHTGDFYRDGLLLASLTGVPVTAVAGNCDGRVDARPDEFMEAAGYRIWLTHGHRYGVKYGLAELRDWAARYEADIVVYGHTHQPFCSDEAGLVLFNPGSPAMPRRGAPRSCGILELTPEREKIDSRLISIC